MGLIGEQGKTHQGHINVSPRELAIEGMTGLVRDITHCIQAIATCALLDRLQYRQDGAVFRRHKDVLAVLIHCPITFLGVTYYGTVKHDLGGGM